MPELHAFHAFWLEKNKTVTAGAWHEGKMPKTGANTITLKRPLRFGPGFRWCFLDVQGTFDQFRILVAYNKSKEIFSAYLFKKVNLQSLMLARLENHSTHPGIHIHACCSPTDINALGRTQYDGLIRCPSGDSHHRNSECPVSDIDALDLVGKHFNLPNIRRSLPVQGELIYE